MILVTGSVIAKPDTIDEMLRVSLEHVHRSRAEPGCISHDVAVDPQNRLRLLFIERWADAAALKAHFRVKASQIMFKTLQSLAADPGAMKITKRARSRSERIADCQAFDCLTVLQIFRIERRATRPLRRGKQH